MTRKALRTRPQRQAQISRPRSGSGPSWMRFGAFVASAAVGSSPAVAAIVPAAQGPSVPQQDPATRRYDIPAGPLSDAIPAFERVSGVRVTLDLATIGSLQSPGVSGVLTVPQALGALLTGTGVRARFTSATAVVLEIGGQSESVDVTGLAPRTTIASPKYTTSLRDTPQTVEVIPRAAMEQQGVTTLSEALRNVPGITLQAGEGGGASSTAGDMFNMRGFSANNSLFVDGVRDDGLISRDVFNL